MSGKINSAEKAGASEPLMPTRRQAYAAWVGVPESIELTKEQRAHEFLVVGDAIYHKGLLEVPNDWAAEAEEFAAYMGVSIVIPWDETSIAGQQYVDGQAYFRGLLQPPIGWRERLAVVAVEPSIAVEQPKVTGIQAVLDERGSRYGSFDGHARITQALKRVFQASPNWHELNASQKEALEMDAHKIGRILNGDPNYLDSWVDIVGYTQLVVNELQEQEEQQAKEVK